MGRTNLVFAVTGSLFLIPEWLERSLKTISFHPLSWAGRPLHYPRLLQDLSNLPLITACSLVQSLDLATTWCASSSNSSWVLLQVALLGQGHSFLSPTSRLFLKWDFRKSAADCKLCSYSHHTSFLWSWTFKCVTKCNQVFRDWHIFHSNPTLPLWTGHSMEKITLFSSLAVVSVSAAFQDLFCLLWTAKKIGKKKNPSP